MRLQGAEIMIRTAGYTAPIRELALYQPGQRVPEPDGDGECHHVRLRRLVHSMGEGDRNFDGGIIASTGRADEIITAEVR